MGAECSHFWQKDVFHECRNESTSGSPASLQTDAFLAGLSPSLAGQRENDEAAKTIMAQQKGEGNDDSKS